MSIRQEPHTVTVDLTEMEHDYSGLIVTESEESFPSEFNEYSSQKSKNGKVPRTYLPSSDCVLPHQQDHIKVYKCGTCPYSSNHLFDLHQHKFSHTVENFYICDFCQSTFQYFLDLKCHLTSHAVDNEIQCSSRKDCARDRKREDSCEKPLRCDPFDYTSVQEYHLKTKRTTLTLKRKIELIEEIEKGKQQKLAARQYGVASNTVSTILKRKDHYKRLYRSGLNVCSMQRHRSAQHEDVEHALLCWLRKARSANIPVNRPALKAKADEIAASVGKHDWKCSFSWITRFNKRHNIVFKNICKKVKDVDHETVDKNIDHEAVDKDMEHETADKDIHHETVNKDVDHEIIDEDIDHEAVDQLWLTVLKNCLEQYQACDIYSASETGIFWRLLPDKLLAFKGKSCHAGQQARERITALCCTNMDGSEKWPLFIIGRFQKARCFNGLKKLPTPYVADQYAWMKGKVFETWLRAFDKTMTSRGRKVALIITSCAAHPLVSNLKSTEVIFLPLDVTSKVQPCKMGIIYNLKMYFRTQLLQRLVAHVNRGAPAAEFQPSLLEAMTMLKFAWNKIEPVTIRNCFRKAGFNHDSLMDDESRQTSLAINAEMSGTGDLASLLTWLFQELGISATVEEVVTVDDSLLTSSPTSCDTPQTQDLATNTEDDVDDLGLCPRQVTNQEVMECMSTISTYLLQSGCTEEVSNAFSKFERLFEKFQHKKKVQA